MWYNITLKIAIHSNILQLNKKKAYYRKSSTIFKTDELLSGCAEWTLKVTLQKSNELQASLLPANYSPTLMNKTTKNYWTAEHISEWLDCKCSLVGKRRHYVLHNQLFSPLSLSLALSLSMSVTQMHTGVYETLLEVQEWMMFSSVIQYG